MNVIQPLGRRLLTDPEGYLINKCHWDDIQPPWLSLVLDLRERYVTLLSDRLHSLYLHGSDPRGLAISDVSDLDSVAILREQIKPELEDSLNSLQIQLAKQYSFCSKLDLTV
ncbi:hypothetical protein OsccyDRAFT_0296 [Leptolyngbyaceae cyanobacterium JSC-12]|nr:hypothetical protein OsccyDRAFT_0296 [Leptolyngbyaceae cyanobacterium JSC-12]